MSYNKFPAVAVNSTDECSVGWPAIFNLLAENLKTTGDRLVTIECYQGADVDGIASAVSRHFPSAEIIHAGDAFRTEEDILKLTEKDITSDRIFGRMTGLGLSAFLAPPEVEQLRAFISRGTETVFVIGTGAALITRSLGGIRIYADMARWEIQLRMRRNEVANVGLSNYDDPFETKYKRGYFLDWRICDAVKQEFADSWDFWLDTNKRDNPRMISDRAFQKALDQTVARPFSVVPFFDPGPWGGQWMREKFDLDKEAPNFAWCFNCVPEENSLLLDFNGVLFETPSINVVFFRPQELLGKPVVDRFGKEFPIRFDFLDTIQGGNLSLQVHPLTDYIRKEFGMEYTQDESYYMLDADNDATVYLGLKSGVDGNAMISELTAAQEKGHMFDADKYTEAWPARKHDHFLIPAGTVHCSGTGCMVLEISATPYIFTFKLWDWGRLGMDGKPRPINIERGKEVIQWDRQKEWTRQNLINRIEIVGEGPGWREERTGLHELEFIETRRHWQTGTVLHKTGGGVNVLMLVEGKEALVESPANEFKPFHVNYAEAFIIPASVKEYTIRPAGESTGKEIATLKAYVRNS